MCFLTNKLICLACSSTCVPIVAASYCLTKTFSRDFSFQFPDLGLFRFFRNNFSCQSSCVPSLEQGSSVDDHGTMKYHNLETLFDVVF